MSIVQMRNIHKYFGKVVALQGVNFEVGSNEVVGLIGDNGAGKSTLIKILSGVYPFTKGEIYIKEQKINPKNYSVKKAHELGIETVFQEQALGIKQTIWRNLFLGREGELAKHLGFIQLNKARRETDKMMKEHLAFTGGGVLPDSTVKTLSGGERQGIAIGRAMYFEADIVILDEPTRALSVKEVGKVLDFIKKVKDSGKSCVYISHTIANVYPVSDRFVILDRGRVVNRYERKEVSEPELNEILIQIHHAPEPTG
ncbi:MAG: ATP-binding cassette domain-containing protein [Candidatus Aerophobetes bacterium]|nr:ATP-binding cassette domain-containing protein [Candidatus Aerophobetes bacterium]